MKKLFIAFGVAISVAGVVLAQGLGGGGISGDDTHVSGDKLIINDSGVTDVCLSDGSTCTGIGSAGTGDVVGPVSSTDNAITRFDLTTGKLVQNSGIVLDDNDVIGSIEALDLNLVPTQTTQEGRLLWDGDAGTMTVGMPGGDVALQLGQEQYLPNRPKNIEGAQINNGQIVYGDSATGSVPEVKLARADLPSTALSAIAVATEDVVDQQRGYYTTSGIVRDVNTDPGTYTAGDLLYLSATTAGAFTNVMPVHPNYNIPIGIVLYAHATEGEIFVKIQTGRGNDTANFFNGSFRESFDALVTSDGATITLSLAGKSSTDLTMQFSDGLELLDTTPAVTATLTAGTDSSPQANYAYVLKSTGALTISTTGWPSTEHIRVGYFYVQSAVAVQSNGALINQNWNNELADTAQMGFLSNIGQWIRAQGANWFSGVDGGGTDGYITPYAGGGYIKVNAGVVMQMHKHNYAAKDTQTGDVAFVENYPGSPFTEVTDLNDMLVDSAGASLTGRYYNIIIGGVANKGGEYSPLVINLPAGSYNSADNAINDVDGFDDYSMPREFNKDSSTGFLIARITIRNQSDTTFTVMNTQDLRGLRDVASGGSLGGGVITNFSDNQFTVYNNLDSTKILAFDSSGITTGNTRTITVPDVSGILALNPMTTPGDLVYGGTAGIETRLGIGTAGQVLTTNAGATAPEWADAAGGGASANFETLTGNKTLVGGTDDQIQYLKVDATDRTVTLDETTSITDSVFEIYNNNGYGGVGYISILDGVAGTELTKLHYGTDSARYVFDGTNWQPLGIAAGDVDANIKANVVIGADAESTARQNVVIGNEASALQYSVIIGQGAGNTSVQQSVTIGRLANDSAGANGGLALGATSVNSGVYGSALGRSSKTANGYDIALGSFSVTQRYGEFWIAADSSLPNDVGRGEVQFYDVTAGGAGATEIFIRDAANARLTLQSSAVIVGEVFCTAFDFTAGETAGYQFTFGYQNIAGTTTEKTNNKTILWEDDATWDVSLSADDTNDSMKVEFTPDGANATEVTCTAKYSEIRS